jgi:hypothetical protein
MPVPAKVRASKAWTSQSAVFIIVVTFRYLGNI